MLTNIIFAMGICRILIGIAPFVWAAAIASLLGFPATHDTPTTRLMARLFGVRDIGLGALVFYGLENPSNLRFILIFNALTDFGDLFAISIPLVRRQGIDKGAFRSAAFALTGGVAWLVVLSQL